MTVDMDTVLDADVKTKTAPPKKYAVVLFNDDYTTMDWVVYILTDIFNHNTETATQITLDVHHNGRGIAGTYPREVAETKRDKVIALSQLNGHPLHCAVEPV